MLPQSNQAARQLTHRPTRPTGAASGHGQTREETLKSIGQHLHQTGAKINRISSAQQRVQEALTCPIPDNVSRLNWIANKLNSQQ